MIELIKYNPKILVIGDLMIDHYVWGSCERISPEAPVQILKVQNENNRLGGACNVANNLIAFGAKVALCGVIGDDNDGEILLKMLESATINTDFVMRDSTFSTIKKTRLLASNQQILRVDRESQMPNLDSAILESLEQKIADFDSVILSDYNKGVLTHSLCQWIIGIAKKLQKPILCDPKGNDYSKYAHSTLITPNKKEAQIATNIIIDSNENLAEAGFMLKKMCDLTYVMITLSEDGMAIFGENLNNDNRGEIPSDKYGNNENPPSAESPQNKNEMCVIPTLAKEVFDVTGAGDTVISALAFGLSCGLDIKKSAEFANAAAAVVVGKIGSASATLGEIFTYLKNDNGSENIHIDSLALLENLRKAGKKIVFTNGCFDVLHSGHVSYLKEAKSFGDILVVGLNSDNSVRRLKGESRPINSQDDRKILLDALECVDFVIIFDEDTPLSLIKKIKPNILVKGGDYKGKVVVGSEIVEDVRLLDFLNGKSTTNIINKIKGENNG